MLRKVSSLLSAALSTMLVLSAGASAKAQAGPVTIGHGTFQAFTQPAVIDFTFVVAEAPSGSTRGFAMFGGFAGPGSLLVMRVSSHMRIGATALFAGEVLVNIGNDPHVQVGQTAFTAVNDNGCGNADEIASLSLVPLPYGNPTIQQIVGLIGPPTPASFTPVLSGNIWAR